MRRRRLREQTLAGSLARLGEGVGDEPKGILPPYEGPLIQTGLRMPKALLARLDRIAKVSKHSRTDVIIHILRWGADQLEHELGIRNESDAENGKK